MTTDVSLQLRARFAALAALECPRCHGAGTWMGSGSFTQNYQERSCSACLGTGRRYPMLRQVLPQVFVCPDCGPAVAVDEDGACSMCGADAEIHRNVGHCRTPLPLDTPADRQRAVGALLEVLSAHDEVEVSWHRGQMFIYRPTEESTGCIGKGTNLEALVAALEALEAEHDAD